ncbi:DUF2510 domain-containing protein [Nocardioides sp. C4-1]|uniref:DUF2510 domain-containing protein n=1 Tax=Nocardioides sp. C4-1 TaxID=3151851 RepID=UPI0032652CF8
MTQGTTPPGWYDDGQGGRRWWDGQRWTEHLQSAQPPPAPAAGPPAPGQQPWPPGPASPGWQPAPRGPRKGLVWGLAGGGVLLVAALAVVLVVVFGGGDDQDDDTADDPPPSSQTTDSDDDSAAGGPTASESPVPPATSEASPEPTEPVPSAPSEGSDGSGGAGSDSLEAMTCGEIRAMSTDQLVDLLDTAAALDAPTDDSAQEYLDLPDSTKRAFAEQLPTACLGEPDGTTLGDLDSF